MPELGCWKAPSRTLTSLRRTALAVSVAAALAALAAGSATAAPSCGQRVIDDWWDNGRIDGTYPIRCYGQALRALPEDMNTYSDMPADIARARRDAIRKQQQERAGEDDRGLSGTGGGDDAGTGGGGGGTSGGTGGTGGTGGSGGADDWTPYGGDTQDPAAGQSQDGRSSDDAGGVFQRALDKVGPSDARSIPLPLVILAAIALMLIAAGGVSLVAQRLQARRVRSPLPPRTPPRRTGV